MSYYYVRDTGTATGDNGRFSTLQSGAFTDATSYSSLYDVFNGGVPATAPVPGDIIVVDDTHLKTYPAATIIGITTGIIITCASSADRSVDSIGAVEQGTGSGHNITLPVASTIELDIKIQGVSFYSSNVIYLSTARNTKYKFKDSALKVTTTSAGDYIDLSDDSGVLDGNNIDISSGSATNTGALRPTGNTVIKLDGGRMLAGRMFNGYNMSAGGATIDIKNYDFTLHDTTSPIFTALILGDQNVNIEFNRCIIPAGLTVAQAVDCSPHTKINTYSCDTGSGYHYFEQYRYQGKVLESTSVYRTGGSTYDGTNGFSAQFQPSNNVIAYSEPLEFKLLELELDLTSVNTLTFQLAFGDDSSAITTFTNAEAWIKLVQNDTTDLALGVITDTKPAGILTTPTDLVSSSETWTGLTHANTDKRQIAIDTVAVPTMTNGQVTAYLCIAKYIDTLEIFCCAKPDIT